MTNVRIQLFIKKNDFLEFYQEMHYIIKSFIEGRSCRVAIEFYVRFTTVKLGNSFALKSTKFSNMASRTELNFKKLLIRCETMAKDRSSGDWRFEKVDIYILLRKGLFILDLFMVYP